MALSTKDKALLDGYRKRFGYCPKDVLRDMLIDRAVNQDNPGASKNDIREYLVDQKLWDGSLDDDQNWTKLLETLKRENDI
jgi:hypothetical protein